MCLCHSQPVSETAGEVLTAESTGQHRLRLLASLLRAIEESNGGTLSHLEDSEKDEDPPQLLANSDGTGQIRTHFIFQIFV